MHLPIYKSDHHANKKEMRLICYIILLTILGKDGPLQEANQFLEVEKYEEAIQSLKKGLKKYPDKTAVICFNLGQLYNQLGTNDSAQLYYKKALNRIPLDLSSKLNNNQAILSMKQGQVQAAINALKDALLQDQNNEIARFNYELLLKRFRPQQQNEQKEEPQDQKEEKQTNNNIGNRKSAIRSFNSPQSIAESESMVIRRDSLTDEQALQLLEIMRQNEIQYIQQLKKKISSPLKFNKKPAW